MSNYERRFRHRQTGLIVTNSLSTSSGERRYSKDLFWFVNGESLATCIPANLVEHSTDWIQLEPVAWMKPDGTFLHDADPFMDDSEALPIWSVKELIELFDCQARSLAWQAFSAGYNNEDIVTEADTLFENWFETRNQPKQPEPVAQLVLNL